MDAQIKGTTLPLLEIGLDPGESVISTHGELAWMSANMSMSQSTSSGGQGGFLSGLKRMAGGGGLFVTNYQSSGGHAMVAFAAKLPGRIFPVEVAPGAGYLVHRHGWLCGTPGIVPTVGLQQSFRGGLWGGNGFVLERLEGQGTAWVELSGEIVEYDLEPGQSILVHPGHVGVFEDRLSYQITRIQGLSNIVFGGDGYHLVALTGPGKVWLQTMPLPILAGALAPYLGGGQTADTAAAGGILGGVLGGSGIFGKNI